jgi:hypothetical protein
MKQLFKTSVLCSLAFILFIQCERPSAPDFKTNQTIEIPVIQKRSFQFIGIDKNALIDIRNPDFADLFKVDVEDNFVTLSFEEDFDFGDLEDAIPVLDADPISVDAEVGEIQLSEFSSQGEDDGSLGSASFEQLTGFSPALFPAGTPVPAGGSPFPVNISLDTDYFISATIKSGSLFVRIRNQLGLDLDVLSLDLRSGSNVIGNIVFSNLEHDDAETQSLAIPDGTVLEDINVDVEIIWAAQNMQDEPDELIIRDVGGSNLFASQVVAVIGAQDFSTSGFSVMDDAEFLFETANDFIQLNSGELRINQLVNNMGIGIDVFRISFPDIRTSPYTAADSLVISFENANRIEANSILENLIVNLANTRIYAEGNVIDYNVYALTEDRQSGEGSQAVTINETDDVIAEIQISNLVIGRVEGTVIKRTINLNDEDPITGNIDLFNDDQANIIEVDGLEDLSENLEGLEFTEASLGITYNTNIGVEASIIGSFVGITATGDRFYLRGLPGSGFHVQAGEVDNLTANGVPLSTNQLIKFNLDTSPDGNLTPGSISFNKDNTNITEFLNRLPTEIRFVGVAIINENNQRGIIVNPVRFDPFISVDIPLSIQTLEAATYSDTLKLDLSDLPDDDDDLVIDEGRLQLTYTNALPLRVDLEFNFLDENNNIVTRSPLPGEQPHRFNAAPVDAVTRYVTNGVDGTIGINLNREQLRLLRQTRNLELNAYMLTTDGQVVKIRSIDSIGLGIGLKIKLENSFN